MVFSSSEIERFWNSKYGDVTRTGWRVRLRRRFGYFTPDDHYEATVEKYVHSDANWLDVGCGRNLFPSNPSLSRKLASRCGRLTGVDPDDTLEQNPFVSERIKGTARDCPGNAVYDLITLRMVAEHVEQPQELIAELARLCKPGGRVIVYTVFKWSLAGMLVRCVPFSLHHPVKSVLWQTEPEDTFPAHYRMNTRRSLRELFAAAGFAESDFTYLDDCSIMSRWYWSQFAELCLQKAVHKLGLRYPEICLVGIYRKGSAESFGFAAERKALPLLKAMVH